MKRILIARTDRLGDVVLSTPVIRYMRQTFPDAYIAFMVSPENVDVIKNNPHLNEVIVYDKRGAQKTFWQTIRFAFNLRKKRFDTAIALHPTNRVHIVFFLAVIPLRIGYDRKMKYLLTKRIPHFKQEGSMHEVDYNFDFLKQAGFKVENPDRHPYIVTSSADKVFIDSIQKSFGIGNNVIAIHAGASCPSKRWQAENFAEVIDVLCERHHCDMVLVGADETSSFSALVLSKMKKRAIDLTGMFRVGELAEFLSRCRLFISNDSGPVHVAVASGTPVIVIFGRSDVGLSPRRWGPLGTRDAVIHHPQGCEVCLAHNCKIDFLCLKKVTPTEVVDIAEKVLTSS